MEILIVQAVLWLAAAVIAVPIAHRLGLGSVLGYLLAGVVIGPWVLRLVGREGADVMHFAELGVVMMLFLVGLELDLGRLWRLRLPVFGLGGLQVGLTAAAVTPVAMAVGLPWQQAFAVGLIVAMSSTAIVLQSLSERGLLRSHAGQTSFAILLFQDVAVIPILALFPLLATLHVEPHGEEHGPTLSLVEGLPAWLQAIAVLGAIGAVVVGGRLAVGPALRVVARTRIRELFTAFSLLLVLGVAILMQAVGLSAALGAFIAGVVLASSEYRHELMSDVEPFKGLLLGVFFMAVGASIDFGLLGSAPVTVLGLLVGLVLVKMLVLVAVSAIGRLGKEPGSLVALGLAQVGEFAFVLFSFAEQNGILGRDVTGPLVAATAFSMALTPVLFLLQARVVGPWLAARAPASTRQHDDMDEEAPVIIAGYGRFGQIVGRMIRAQGMEVTMLDVDSEQVEVLAKFGQKVFYGDASRLDLLHAAGAGKAKVLVVAVDEPEKAEEIVDLARKHFPNLAILARARGRSEAYNMLDRGITGVYRETFDTAVRVGVDTLRLLGVPAHAAHRIGRTFRQLDEAALVELAAHRNDQAMLVSRARERMRDFAQVLADDTRRFDRADHDEGWDPEPLREAARTPAEPPRAPESGA
jgi:monovalent cation:proton antiporter-2 (CPA2) family protein